MRIRTRESYPVEGVGGLVQAGMMTWRPGVVLNMIQLNLSCVFLLLLLLDLPLLVEDLLGLPVADKQDDRCKDKNDGSPGCSVSEPERVNSPGS